MPVELSSLLRFKPGVVRDRVHPLMWAWSGAVSVYHAELTGEPATVTSARRPWAPGSSSRHAPPSGELATALDLRRWALDRVGKAEAFCRTIQQRYGAALGVVLEPEWLTVRELEKRFGIRIRTEGELEAARRRVGPHVHLQLKGRLWLPADRGGVA